MSSVTLDHRRSTTHYLTTVVNAGSIAQMCIYAIFIDLKFPHMRINKTDVRYTHSVIDLLKIFSVKVFTSMSHFNEITH